MSQSIPITKEGFDRIKQELQMLKTVDRPAVIQEIATARALGDLSENAEYHSAREKQGFIEGRITELEQKLSQMQVIEPSTKGPVAKVVFGATVYLSDLNDDVRKQYRIVGDMEADIKRNEISISSPLARSLINKSVGDIVTVRLPKGEKEYEIEKVEFL